MQEEYRKDIQYVKFCLYGFLKNLRFFEAFLYLFFLEKGLSFFQIGVLIGIREMARGVLEIPTGLFADFLGRRKMMITAFAFYIISFIIFFFSSSYLYFIFAMLFYAFGDASRTGTHKAMINEYLNLKNWESHKLSYYGSTRSWSQTGSAVSSLIAAMLVFVSGEYSYIFLYSVIPYFLDLLLMISYPEVLDGIDRKERSKGYRLRYSEFLRDLRSSFTKNSIRLLVNTSIFSAWYKVIKDYLQPVILAFVLIIPFHTDLSHEKTTALIIGLVYFLVYLAGAMASGSSGRISEKMKGPASLLNITLIAGLLVSLLIGFLNSQGSFVWESISIILFVVIVMFENFRKPAGVACISNRVEKKVLATSFSVESQLKGLFAAVLAPLLGFLIDRQGIGEGLMILSVFLIVLFPFIRLKHKGE